MYKAYSLDMWYVASSTECFFTKFVQIMPLVITAKLEINTHLINI